jgi:hypothetical protein
VVSWCVGTAPSCLGQDLPIREGKRGDLFFPAQVTPSAERHQGHGFGIQEEEEEEEEEGGGMLQSFIVSTHDGGCVGDATSQQLVVRFPPCRVIVTSAELDTVMSASKLTRK